MQKSLNSSVSEQWPLILAGLISSCAFLFLVANSQHYGDLTLRQFYPAMLIAAASSFWLFWYLQSQGQQVSILGLISFAIFFRALGLFAFPPLEDDFFRYLWDGRMVVESGSPYALAPSAFFTTDGLGDRFDAILGLINYPDIKTVYGPVNQWVFAFAYTISPGQVWPLQAIYALVDLTLVAVLLRMARPNFVLLYAWSPLMIKEFAFTAHPDVLGALFLITAILAHQKHRFTSVAVLLALAAGVKLFAVILVPILLGFRWRAWIVFALSLVALGLPFGILESWFTEGLRAMSGAWLFNAPVYVLLADLVSFNLLKYSLGIIFIAFWLKYYFRGIRSPTNSIVRGDLLFAGLFICSPVLNPWYLVWILPFAVLVPSGWAWVASVSVLLAYASGINLGLSALQPYQISTWVIVVEYLVVLIAAILWRKRSIHDR